MDMAHGDYMQTWAAVSADLIQPVQVNQSLYADDESQVHSHTKARRIDVRWPIHHDGKSEFIEPCGFCVYVNMKALLMHKITQKVVDLDEVISVQITSAARAVLCLVLVFV